MSQLRFCGDVCRALYHRAAKGNTKLQKFALLASQQRRCGFCGESVMVRKLIVIT